MLAYEGPGLDEDDPLALEEYDGEALDLLQDMDETTKVKHFLKFL